jgi:hypothetical protein
MKLTQPVIFTFFRMGLVTGLVDRQAVTAWADRQILAAPVPDPHIMELSLAGSQPHSQLIGLLNQLLEGFVEVDIPMKLLFAHARKLLEDDPGRAKEIAQGLVLLLAEEFLPRDLQNELYSIEGDLELFQLSLLSSQAFKGRLKGFLDFYSPYRSYAADLILN